MTSAKRVTMKDIGASLGVHQTTVSLALRNHPSLPKETCLRVQARAREMGYAPDPMLASLNAYRSAQRTPKSPPSIAYISDFKDRDELDSMPPRLLFYEGARERAHELGYRLELFFCGKRNFNAKALDRILFTRHVEGVIVAAFSYLTTLELSWDHYSVVKIEMLPFDLNFDVIENNQMQATRLAMDKLFELGFRRVGMATGRHDEVHTRNLFSAGYMVGQQNYPEVCRVPLFTFPTPNVEASFIDLVHWLRIHEVEVLISNWNELRPYMERIRRAVRRDVQFVSLDLEQHHPDAMGVVQSHFEVGRHAVEYLVGQMRANTRGPARSKKIHLIDPVWREAPISVGP